MSEVIFNEGDDVLYNGKENSIESIEGDKALIQNPDWTDDEDDDFIPFWIWVDLTELSIN